MDYENKKVNNNITLGKQFKVPAMEDYFIEVRFKYPIGTWSGCIPIISRYQGINIPQNKVDVFAHAEQCYSALHPNNYSNWNTQQLEYWRNLDASDTEVVFNALNPNSPFTNWQCRKCGPVPQVNPQPAARIKNLKIKGYVIASRKMDCPSCGKKQTFDLLIRLPRHEIYVVKRYNISKKLNHKIKTVLPLKDSCFDLPKKANELIIDHKFPSQRWINGESINFDSMTEEEIKSKFQLLTNQTNLIKSRYCDACVSTNKRGTYMGIKWYSEGNENWNGTSPSDENGCKGCPWYDLEDWKNKLSLKLNSNT